MSGIKCFFMDPTENERIWLRRYNGNDKCAVAEHGYHQSWVFFGDRHRVPSCYGHDVDAEPEMLPHDDPRWPSSCRCSYIFTDDDNWQMFNSRLYRRCDNQELVTLREAPVGAMWYAKWMPKNMYWDNKEDVDHLMVRLPDGTDWCVDSRCNNCTLPNDRLHRCWVRTGTPPYVTVGKEGFTCSAGAGSVQSPGWHGYLRNGELVV